MMERWMRVVKDKRFTTGATIPYILAAVRDPIGSVASVDSTREQLRGLLLAMARRCTASECVVILWCAQRSKRLSPQRVRRRLTPTSAAGTCLRGWRLTG